MFKKLFEITYKKKNFLLLATEEHRITFLEIDKDGNLKYPEYSDFIELYEIYNNHDIKYEEKTVKYKEKVNWKGMLLSVIVSTGIYGGAINLVLRPNTRSLELIGQTITQEVYSNRSDLSTYYEDEVTREDVINAIQNNPNIEDYYKEIAIRVMDANIAQDPNINLRIYYENMNDLKITIVPKISLRSWLNSDYAGWFDSLKCEISLQEEYAKNENVVAHELNHAMYCLYTHNEDHVIRLNEDHGDSLMEAMTNRIIENEFGYHGSYEIQQKVLDFLMNCADEFDYSTYNKYGISALIEELKEKYPEVDIDYIVDYMDAMTKTYHHSEMIQMKTKNYNFIMNELLKLAKANINVDNPYDEFERFLELISKEEDIHTIEQYFREYNQVLQEKGIAIANTYEMYQMILKKDVREFFKGKTDEEKKELLDKIFNELRNNINREKLYSNFYLFDSILSKVDYGSYSTLEEYRRRYDEQIVKNGYLTAEQIGQIRSMVGIAKDGDSLYWVYKRGDVFDGVFQNRSFKMIAIDGNFDFVTDNESGLIVDGEINNILFDYSNFFEMDQDRLLTLIANNPELEEFYKNDNKKALIEQLHIFDDTIYNTFENGEKAFDTITPDMTVEIGFDENKEIGLILRDKDHVIYGTCQRFSSIPVKIPYQIYSNLVERMSTQGYTTIESIISPEYFKKIRTDFLEYLLPSVYVNYVEEKDENNEGKKKAQYDFREPTIVKIDENTYTSRDIYVYIDFEKTKEDILERITLHIPGENIFLGNYSDMSYRGKYLLNNLFLDELFEELGIQPTYDNVYEYSREELINTITSILFSENEIIEEKSIKK